MDAVDWDYALEVFWDSFSEQSLGVWTEKFSDVDVLGALIRDILGVVASSDLKRGPRPKPVFDGNVLNVFSGTDYSEHVFGDALNILLRARQWGIERLSHASNIDEIRLKHFLDGSQLPSVQEMCCVADAFNKNPGYFVEYRVAAMGSMLMRALSQNVDYATVLFDKISRGVL